MSIYNTTSIVTNHHTIYPILFLIYIPPCSALQELKALNDGSTTGPAGSVNSGNSGPSSGPNSNSIGGRISAFNQKAGVVGSGAPDVAEAKENPGSPNTNTKTKALTLAEPTFTASGDLIGNTVQQDKPAPFDPAADLNPLSSFSPNEDNGAKVNNDFGMGGMAMGLAGVEAGGSVSTLGSGGVYNPNSQSQGPVVGAVASNTAAAAANADNSIGNSGKAGSRPLGQLGTVSSQPLSWGGGSSNASKPHHLPKMALSGLQVRWSLSIFVYDGMGLCVMVFMSLCSRCSSLVHVSIHHIWFRIQSALMVWCFTLYFISRTNLQPMTTKQIYQYTNM